MTNIRKLDEIPPLDLEKEAILSWLISRLRFSGID
jgi:hypothetical protein